MTIDIYKFKDGKSYMQVGESRLGACDGCSFEYHADKCSESSEYATCISSNSIWKPVEEKTMKSITQEIKDFNPESFNLKQRPGTKYDDNKLQYSLIPPHALMEVARNLTIGLKKYEERDNWKKVPNASQRYLDALYRHLEAYRRGEIYDPDSSVQDMPHLAAVAVNAMFLLEFMLNKNLEEVKE